MIEPQQNRPYFDKDGRPTNEGLQMLLSLFDEVEAQKAQIAALEARVTALEP
ncbi:hypothetical protein AB3Y40_06800 [Yoonia sp. R2331]|uniref:hypothetical protein n=1 Tax=Yoonia sp. R2331 TaxID=3237238 RepID=UPI0034E4AD0D